MTSVRTDRLRPLVLACGALAADLRAVLAAGGFDMHIEVEYLPANLHNRPELIAPALRPRLQAAFDAGRPVFVAYADCGTGGVLDALLAEFPGVDRLPGAHCYEVFTGTVTFDDLHHDELGTFYLTDFLAKHFDALVWSGLGLDCHPELRDTYFGAYRRVVLLSQAPDANVPDSDVPDSDVPDSDVPDSDVPDSDVPDSDVVARARAAAARLGLEFVHHPTGRAGLRTPVLAFADQRVAHDAPAR